METYFIIKRYIIDVWQSPNKILTLTSTASLKTQDVIWTCIRSFKRRLVSTGILVVYIKWSTHWALWISESSNSKYQLLYTYESSYVICEIQCLESVRHYSTSGYMITSKKIKNLQRCSWRYTNTDLKISVYLRVHIKSIP